MAITRPCIDSDDPAAIALYLQALAFDAEAQLTAKATALTTTQKQAASIVRITANYNTFATNTVADQVFLSAATTFDIFETSDDPTGLWAFGFTLRTDPLGAKTQTTFRQAICQAGYTNSFGDYTVLAQIQDVEFEGNTTLITALNAAGTFVVPQELTNIGFPDIRLYFTYSNAGSNMEILSQSTLWYHRISAHDQLVINDA